MRSCKHCGVEIPADANALKIYCTDKCRKRAWHIDYQNLHGTSYGAVRYWLYDRAAMGRGK